MDIKSYLQSICEELNIDITEFDIHRTSKPTKGKRYYSRSVYRSTKYYVLHCEDLNVVLLWKRDIKPRRSVFSVKYDDIIEALDNGYPVVKGVEYRCWRLEKVDVIKWNDLRNYVASVAFQ